MKIIHYTVGNLITRCQAVAKFCKDYQPRTVPARRDYIFIIALPWGHANATVELVCCYNTSLLPSNAHVPHLWDTYMHSAWQLHAIWLLQPPQL